MVRVYEPVGYPDAKLLTLRGITSPLTVIQLLNVATAEFTAEYTSQFPAAGERQ